MSIQMDRQLFFLRNINQQLNRKEQTTFWISIGAIRRLFLSVDVVVDVEQTKLISEEISTERKTKCLIKILEDFRFARLVTGFMV